MDGQYGAIKSYPLKTISNAVKNVEITQIYYICTDSIKKKFIYILMLNLDTYTIWGELILELAIFYDQLKNNCKAKESLTFVVIKEATVFSM